MTAQEIVDRVHLLDVLRVVDEDDERVAVAPERYPQRLLQIVDLQVLHHVGRRQDSLVELDERTVIELAEGRPQLALGYRVVLQQERFHVGLPLTGFGRGLGELAGCDDVLGQQIVELAGPLLRELVLGVEGDAERPGDAGDAGLVLLGEARAALLVQELDHADHAELVHDRHGQHLPRQEPRLLVPGAVELQERRDPFQLGRIVGVDDVHHPARQRDEARDALLADGHADLAHLGDGAGRQEARV